ncbi:MAG: mitochondrial fission ELM1 family protein [Alphaproteobacteria bacterium]|nr:mitochondrial fission ELM1 family protein [Alphaproteobacteria bacterium]
MKSHDTAPLRVLLISDGRPGHFNLSEGIVAAVARRRTVEVQRLEVRRPGWTPGWALAALTNAGMSPVRILQSVYGIPADSLGQPQLIVSAGGNTLAANIAAARLTKAPNIFYGSLRRFSPRDFALVMTSYAADVHAQNRLMWLKPSKLDPAAGPPVQSAKPAAANASAPQNLGLIVGGDAGTVHYDRDDWDRLFALLEACSKAWQARWIVANAPRTPDAVSDRLAALASTPDSTIATFIDVRSAGPGTLGLLLGGSRAVVCTADSSTMLSETVWMQRPVVAVAPRDFALPENETAYRDWLEKNGWSRQMPIDGLTPEILSAALAGIVPLADNPLDRLADELHRRLPTLFN